MKKNKINQVVLFLLLTIFSYEFSLAQSKSLENSNIPIVNVDKMFSCIDPDFRNMIQLNKEGETIKANFTYPTGSMSVDSDPLSTLRAGQLNKKNKLAKVFEELPSDFVIHFDSKDCKFDSSNGEVLFGCVNRSEGQLGGFSYHNVGLMVYTQSIKSPFSSYSLVNVKLTFGKVMGESESTILISNHSSTIAYENSETIGSCDGSLLDSSLVF